MENSTINMQGFAIFRQDRISTQPYVKKRGGGLIVYAKHKWESYVSILTKLSIVSSDVEVVWLLLDPPNHKRIILGTVYRPPSGNIQEAIDSLDTCLILLGEDYATAEIYIIGDFNVDYKKTTTLEYKILKEFERNHQLKQYIKKPTRITNKVKSTIDLIFSNMNFIEESGVLLDEISDHLPIFIRRKKGRERKSFTHIRGRSMKNYDKTLFQSVLVADKQWKLFWDAKPDVNILWDILLNIILNAVELMCPMKRISTVAPKYNCSLLLTHLFSSPHPFVLFSSPICSLLRTHFPFLRTHFPLLLTHLFSSPHPFYSSPHPFFSSPHPVFSSPYP